LLLHGRLLSRRIIEQVIIPSEVTARVCSLRGLCLLLRGRGVGREGIPALLRRRLLLSLLRLSLLWLLEISPIVPTFCCAGAV